MHRSGGDLSALPNHNGGNLAFGPDGYLYIGLGDGGSGNDPEHRAQNPSKLLGKMLRIKCQRRRRTSSGYDVPPDNPFITRASARGARDLERSACAIRGDTASTIRARWQRRAGHRRRRAEQLEEIDYEPRGRGGRNYGWRNREGAHNNVTSCRRPIAADRSDPRVRPMPGAVGDRRLRLSGPSLGSDYRGRYFFADFVSGRVWSLGLNVEGGGEASERDHRAHGADGDPSDDGKHQLVRCRC